MRNTSLLIYGRHSDPNTCLDQSTGFAGSAAAPQFKSTTEPTNALAARRLAMLYPYAVFITNLCTSNRRSLRRE